ncbi:MAG: single-stranded-DNA-specific exonuclease RecJ [Desulfamplus sp.]|nr:single-stranded-DNA-specific exonuclease RecJ [Desulfamplus sp.]
MQRQWLTLTPDLEMAARISRIVGCHETLAKLLVNRGITTPEEAFTFLNPSFQHLADPFTLKDMKKAVERIYTAICNKEKILIFGDFDADGITATVLLNDFFNYVEADVSWYIPHRIKEGYSLKVQHIEMAVRQRCDLLITVDCGSDSHDAVRAAIKEDIDIIITDHHEITGFRPPAFAVINPKQKSCPSGLEHLAGVGVAFYLIIALRSYLRQQGFWEEISEPKLIDYCDLFAIGTIADMVPLKAENRTLSKAGISLIRKGKREGLKSLIKISGLDQANINSDDISFRIAPRINAAGRISHSRICVDLLSEKSSAKAEQTAFILEELNKKRQEIEKWIVDEIERRILIDPEIIKRNSIVMEDKRWNAGVLGIAASRIAKKYFRPVVLISTASVNEPASNVYSAVSTSNNTNNGTTNYATGSCRSVGEINIHNALSQCSDLLENFGGHRMAAGILIKVENIEKFSERFEQAIEKIIKSSESKTVKRSDADIIEVENNFEQSMIFDTNLDFDEITEVLVDEIDRLRPYGTDNPEPLFCCSDIKVISSFMIGSKHRKMVLQQNPKSIAMEQNLKSIEAMQFNIGRSIDNDRSVELEESMSVTMLDRFEKIAFRLQMNRFIGKNTPQIVIEDAQI